MNNRQCCKISKTIQFCEFTIKHTTTTYYVPFLDIHQLICIKKRRVQLFYKIKATILNTKTTIKRIPIHLMHLKVNLIAK